MTNIKGESIKCAIPIEQDTKTTERMLKFDGASHGYNGLAFQITFSSRCLNQTRRIYDQLNVLSPLLLSMSASTCIYGRRLLDLCTRYEVAAQGTDDRSFLDKKFMTQRYSNITHYVSNEVINKNHYNDSPTRIN